GGGAYTPDATKITCGQGPVPYWGMPFAVDAAFANDALAVLAAFNAATGTFNQVPIHRVNHPFDAPVAVTLASRPKPVGIGPNFGLNTYFDESGVTAVVPAGTSSVLIVPTG